MERVQTQAPKIRDLIETSNSFYQDLLGYFPEKTSLQQIPGNQWNEFATQKGLNPNSSGIYLPRNQTAIIRNENPLVLFHEYFGHGLYCEQSLSGRKLVDLERKLLEEEKQEFSSEKFSLEELKEFRQQNQTFQELENFRQENLTQYEFFAIFTEYLLSKKFNIEEMFEQKYDSLSEENQQAIENIISFNQKYGDLASFYGFGLRKIQDRKRLKKLSEDLFGDSLQKIKLIAHFGSGKSFSDIDLFVVSNDINSFYSNWIDVRANNLREIENGISVLDPKITDPIIIGKFIFGKRDYQNELKKKILNQEITGDAINFNLQKWKHHNKKSQDSSLSKHFQNKNLRSSKTYLTNALALKNGYKILTFNGLVEYSHALSHSEKFIELKGGIE